MPTTSVELQVLLAVVTAAIDADAKCVVRRALDRQLGSGWAWEFASTRSPEERIAVLFRRLQMAETNFGRFDPLRRETVADASSHEDGGAR